MIRIHHDTTASGPKWPHSLEVNDRYDQVEITIDDEPSCQAFSIELNKGEVRQLVDALSEWLSNRPEPIPYYVSTCGHYDPMLGPCICGKPANHQPGGKFYRQQ